MGDNPESPSSRCTSPDLHGYTTAGEEQVAGDTSDCSSNRTVRDPSPPRLRPRAHTVPKFIWKQPAGDHRPTGGPLRLRDLKKRYQGGRRGEAVVLGESDDSVVGSAADLLEGLGVPELGRIRRRSAQKIGGDPPLVDSGPERGAICLRGGPLYSP
jgi:hypothetical protein